MANVKISQLPSLSTMTDLAQIPVVAGGTTYQITGSNLSAYFSTSAAGSKIVNGSTEANIGASGGNANISVGGISNVAVFTQSGVIVSGVLTAPVLTTNNIRSDDSSFVNIEDGVNITGAVIAAGNVVGNYFIGNGSQLTGVSSTGNLDITGTTIEIAAGASETVLEIRPDNSPGWAYLKLPNDATSNTVDTQLNNDNGNVSIGTGGDQFGVFPTWLFDNTGNLTLPEGGSLFSQSSTPSGSPGNTIVLQPAGSGVTTGQKLMIYPTANDGDHIHLTSGNLYQTELFLGSDNFYVKLANTGDIVVQTDGGVGNTAQWTFGSGGTLTAPGNIIVPSLITNNIRSDDSSFVNIEDGVNVTGDIVASSNIIGAAANIPSIVSQNLDVENISARGAAGVNIGAGGFNNLVVEQTRVLIQNVPLSVSGNITGGNATLGTLTLSGNTISSTDAIITIDPAAAGNTGAVIIQGNLSVTGNVTYIDSNTITTNDLVINLANNAATAAAANGGGIGVGPVTGEYATITYNSTANIWAISNGASVTGNITGGNLNAAGLSLSSNVVSAINTIANITTTANISGGYILGNGSQLTGVNAVTVDVTDTNGLTTIYYPTFVENRTTAQIARADVNLTYRTDDNLLTVGNVSVTGNIDGGNLRTAGQVSASGNVTGGNLITAGDISAASVSASGNITGGNIVTGGIGGNISGANIISGTTLSATSKVITAPVAYSTLTAVTGARAFVNDGNLVASGNFGAQVSGGGANTVPVWSNGTNWYIG